eukprot:c20232_g1_i1 orf=409-966(-)
MEALSICPFAHTVRSPQRSRRSHPSKYGNASNPVEIVYCRSFAACSDAKIAVSAEKGKRMHRVVIDILRGRIGRSVSRWWDPFSNLPSEASWYDTHVKTELPILSVDASEGIGSGINPGGNGTAASRTTDSVSRCSSNVSDRKSRSVKFTAEKAKLLRQELRATETWQDSMYHSAIASRLATPDN